MTPLKPQDEMCGDATTVRMTRLVALITSLVATVIEFLLRGVGMRNTYKLLTRTDLPPGVNFTDLLSSSQMVVFYTRIQSASLA